MTPKIFSKSGFTLIEILMVVMLLGILAAVGISQFFDFQTEAKNAATRASLAVLRNGINTQYAQMRLRCAVTDGTWPSVTSINANNIADGNSTCSPALITNQADHKFVAGDQLPPNPWGIQGAASAYTVVSCTNCVVDDATACAGAAHSSATDAGWCYNPSNGAIWANSKNNGGTSGVDTENLF